MKKILLILSVSLAFISCQEKTADREQNSEAGRMSFAEEIQVTSNRRVSLLPEAQTEVSQWLAYITAQNEMESLKKGTGNDILDTSNSLLQIMESLHTTLPDTLRSPAVEARANVLLTKAHVLHQHATKKEKDASEVFQVANELIVEWDNFKLQLNELYLKAPGDFEMELDEEFERARSEDTLPAMPARQ